MTEQERAFHDALMDATRECKRLRYNPAYALQMVGELGAVGACKRLLEKTEMSEGFTRLWELGRLDLTVEAVALRPNSHRSSPPTNKPSHASGWRLSDTPFLRDPSRSGLDRHLAQI